MGLLTREAEKSGVQPIVVGGSAVDIYTEGIYPSQDIDLVSNRKIIGEILVNVFNFKPSGRHWINEQIGLSVEVPDNRLAGDKDKVTVVKIENLKVYVIGIEDLFSDPKGRVAKNRTLKKASSCKRSPRMNVFGEGFIAKSSGFYNEKK